MRVSTRRIFLTSLGGTGIGLVLGKKTSADEKVLSPNERITTLEAQVKQQGEKIEELTKKIEELTSSPENAFSSHYKEAVAVKAHLTTYVQPNGTRLQGYASQGSGTVVETNIGRVFLTNVHNLLNGIKMEDLIKKPYDQIITTLLSMGNNTEVVVILPGGKEVKAKPLIIIKDGKEIPGLHAFRDVAILVPSEDITGETKPVNFSLEKPKPGTEVIALGDPLAGQYKIVPAVTQGVISTVGDYHPFSMDKNDISQRSNNDDYNLYVVCDLNVFPGNSGGPLIDLRRDLCYGMIGQKIEIGNSSLSRALSVEEIVQFGKERGIKFLPYPASGNVDLAGAWKMERTAKYNVFRFKTAM